MNNASQLPTQDPWWRFPMVWLVMGGPVVVVIACLVTTWIAVSHPDPIVSDSVRGAEPIPPAEMPAQQARNHAAATGR